MIESTTVFDPECRSRRHRWRRQGLSRFLPLPNPRRVTCRRCGCQRTRMKDGGYRYSYPPRKEI